MNVLAVVGCDRQRPGKNPTKNTFLNVFGGEMTTASHHVPHVFADRDHVRSAALTMGILFLLLGILAFIPGIATNYSSMAFAAGSEAMLFGVFQTSMLLNIVYLVTGAAGWLMSHTAARSRDFLIGAGAVYLLLWVYGLIIDMGSTANFLSINAATNWMHLVLGLVTAGLGVAYMIRHRRDHGAVRGNDRSM